MADRRARAAGEPSPRRAGRIWIAAALVLVLAAGAVRVATWLPSGSGLRRPDHYPEPTVPLPPGTRVARRPPGVWETRALAPGSRSVWALPIEIVLPPDPDSGPDSSRYAALYTAPLGGTGSGGPDASRPHRVIVLDERPSGAAWAARAGALTRSAQWCVNVDLGRQAPSDSLVLLIAQAARLVER